jgi:hypothetical protein
VLARNRRALDADTAEYEENSNYLRCVHEEEEEEENK